MSATRARHIFCAYAVTDHHIDMVRRDAPIFEARIAALGDYTIVITNPTKFLERVRAATKAQRLALRGGLVDYVDLTTHDGKLDPFKKDVRFAYQHEYRLMVSETGNDFLNLDVGSLHDIAQRSLGRDLNRAVQEAIQTQLMDREPP